MYYTINYQYNADGIRTVKEVIDGDMDERYLHEYTLNGSQIVKETVYNDTGDGYTEIYTLVYIYDETGAPIGMKYRTPYMAVDTYTCFFFEKNMQGDIVSVYNSSGVKVIAYTYDAWGNCTTSYPNGYSGITGATYNPFRYRGYYYDTDTGLYYLQSRYYNPQWGRFISSDGYISIGRGIMGYNMFSYCCSNPIMYGDAGGREMHPLYGYDTDEYDSYEDYLAGIKSSGTTSSTYYNGEEIIPGSNYDYMSGMVSGVSGFGVTIAQAAGEISIALATRPANIGAGIFAKQCAQQTARLNVYGLKASIAVSAFFVFMDVAMGVNNNIQTGAPLDKIAFDASIDILFSGGTAAVSIWTATKVGAAFGSCTLSPGIGTLIGGAAGTVVGLFIWAIVDIPWDGTSIRQKLKDTYE